MLSGLEPQVECGKRLAVYPFSREHFKLSGHEPFPDSVVEPGRKVVCCSQFVPADQCFAFCSSKLTMTHVLERPGLEDDDLSRSTPPP